MNNNTADLMCRITVLEACTLDGGMLAVVLLFPMRNYLCSD